MNKTIDIRHPEKIKNASLPMSRKPKWIKVKAPLSNGYKKLRPILSKQSQTICEEASCPNIGDCWSKGHATFLIMGTFVHEDALCNVKLYTSS